MVHRPEFVRDDESDWVLLPVHLPQSEGFKGFVEVYADRVCPQRLEGLNTDRYPDHADIQPMQILWSAYWTLRIGQLPVAVLSPRDGNDPFQLDQLKEALARISGLHCVESGVARKHELQGEQVQLLHLWRPVDCRSYRKVDDPLLQKLELGCLRTSGSPAIEVIRDLNASFRPIFDGGGKPVGRPAPRGLLARVDGHLEFGLVLRRERSSREKAGSDYEEDSCAFHGYILVQVADYIQTITRQHPCRTDY